MFSYEIRDSSNPEYLANWVEFYLQVEGSGEISKSNLISAIEANSGEGNSEVLVDDVWQSLERRQFLYGSNPPYKIDPKIAIKLVSWKSHPFYLACLIFTMEGNNINAKISGDLFEKLCNESVKFFLQGESFIYGYPAKASLKQIAEDMNEEFFKDPPGARKDRGVDLISWKSFGDDRPSQVVVLTQCAAGRNWKKKCTELDLAVWDSQYINFLCNPIKALAIPFVYPDDVVSYDYAKSAGLIIDRPRIYQALSQITLDRTLNTEIKKWCKLRLSQIFIKNK